MNTYTISRQFDTLFRVKAENYTSAATKAARRLYGRKATARRTTGDLGMSGYFQAYEPVAQRLGGGLSSIGDPFHVR